MLRSHALDKLAGGLAAAFLAGEWNEAGLVRRGRDAVQPPPRWMRRVAAEVLAHYHRPPLDRPRELTRFIELQLSRIPLPAQVRPSVRHWYTFEQSMGRRRWPVAELDGLDQLAGLLRLTAGELDWLADVRSIAAEIAHEDGFRLNHAKTRAMGAADASRSIPTSALTCWGASRGSSSSTRGAAGSCTNAFARIDWGG